MAPLETEPPDGRDDDEGPSCPPQLTPHHEQGRGPRGQDHEPPGADPVGQVPDEGLDQRGGPEKRRQAPGQRVGERQLFLQEWDEGRQEGRVSAVDQVPG